MDAELEQRIAEMSDADFAALVARTRPPAITSSTAAKEDWKTSFATKTAQLRQLMNPTRGD